MRSRNLIFTCIGLITSLWLVFPSIACAHLISITATTPFPATVPVSSTTTANFTVTNLTSRVNLTVVDQSQFPRNSGLSISTSTCGTLMGPGQSCNISVQLNAPSTPQTISSELREWAKPSADGVRYPFSVVVRNAEQFTINASAGAHGTIAPSGTQTVNEGSSITFTATPQPGYLVYQWLLDGNLVQTGGTSFTLSNITANHTVQVSFALNSIAIAAGENFAETFPPLLVATTNGGNSWSTVSISGAPLTGSLASASCTGTGASSICITAGLDASGSELAPLLISSRDGANTWNKVSDIPNTGLFSASSCSGNESTAICIAAGSENILSGPALLVVSRDGAASWSNATPSITGLSGTEQFSAAGCTGDGTTAICIVGGTSTFLSGSPVLATSLDGGATWNNISTTIGGLPANGVIRSASCTGTGATAICIAAGREGFITSTPLLLGSTNGGNSFTNITGAIGGLPASGSFTEASCTGTGATAICIAVGQDNTGLQPPLLVLSTDGGNTWNNITAIPSLPNDQAFYAASCTGSGSNAICIAAGGAEDGSQPPLLVVSKDGGASWQVVTNISGLPGNGVFFAANCSGTGSSAICIAAGQSRAGTNPPLLVMSTDGGNTWTNVIPSGLPSTGVFNSAAGSNSLLKKRSSYIKKI